MYIHVFPYMEVQVDGYHVCVVHAIFDMEAGPLDQVDLWPLLSTALRWPARRWLVQLQQLFEGCNCPSEDVPISSMKLEVIAHSFNMFLTNSF